MTQKKEIVKFTPKDRKVPESTKARQQKRRARLHALARVVGYDSWYKLETAILNNQVTVIKATDPAAEFCRRYGMVQDDTEADYWKEQAELEALGEELKDQLRPDQETMDRICAKVFKDDGAGAPGEES